MLGSIVSPLDGFRSPFGPPRGFNPARLFGPTDTGWIYDLSDMSTLFQDAAGTTPVTAVGQPVGLQLDKSGRGNHRSQSVSLNRPTLRQDTNGLYYLEYDGLNDSLSTAPFAWGTDKATICAGVRKLSDAAYRAIAEFSANVNSNNGAFAIGNGDASGRAWSFVARGTSINAVGSFTAAPDTAVIAGISDISSPLTRIRRNGVAGAVGAASLTLGTGNFGTHPVFFGARAGTSAFFNGWEYSQFAINRLLTANELSQIERYAAQRTGVTL